MSNRKIKFSFAFNAKLNGYLSYLLPLQFTPTNVWVYAFSFFSFFSWALLTTLFPFIQVVLKQPGNALYSSAISIPI